MSRVFAFRSATWSDFHFWTLNCDNRNNEWNQTKVSEPIQFIKKKKKESKNTQKGPKAKALDHLYLSDLMGFCYLYRQFLNQLVTKILILALDFVLRLYIREQKYGTNGKTKQNLKYVRTHIKL